MRDIMDFSLATGLRKSNVTKLEWSQVDLKRKVAWIHADQAKSRKPIGVPLNRKPMQVLNAPRGKHPKRVFSYGCKSVNSANTKAWRTALKKAGIEDFRWHDLRHTWASWHVQNGTPLSVLRELGGRSDIQMVLKYAHLAPEHLAQHAENICDIQKMTSNVAHFPAHNTNESLLVKNKGHNPLFFIVLWRARRGSNSRPPGSKG
jgi:integrase